MTDDYQDREWSTRRKFQVLGGGAGVVAALAIALYAAQPSTAPTSVAAASLPLPAAAAPPVVPAPAMPAPAALPAPAAALPTVLAPTDPGRSAHVPASAVRRAGSSVLRTVRYSKGCIDPDHDRDCDTHSRHVRHASRGRN